MMLLNLIGGLRPLFLSRARQLQTLSRPLMTKPVVKVTSLSLFSGNLIEEGTRQLALVNVMVHGAPLRGCMLTALPEGDPVLIPPRTDARRNRDRERRAADHPAWRAVTAAALVAFREAGGRLPAPHDLGAPHERPLD
ncbi:hypothetical protein ACW7BJ_20985 [Azospirillum argentinense]